MPIKRLVCNGPTMLDPTPVSHTIVIIMRYDNFANFPLHSIKISIPRTTIRLKNKFTFTHRQN